MKDHLGNVRSVIESRTLLIQEFLASYEIASAAIEGLYFDNHNEIRDLNPSTSDPDNEYSGRLNANEADRLIGTSILTHVMAGDQIELNINSFFDDYNSLVDDPISAEDVIQTLSSVLTAGEGGFEGSESHATDLVGMLFDDFNVSSFEDILDNHTDPTKPKAYLTYLLFDENMQLVPGASRSFQVEGNGTWGEIGTTQPVIMPENGYLAVFLHTATTNADCHECANVFFDQLVFRVTRGSLKEEAHYYPHGLPIVGMGSTATGFKENRFKYQGNEFNKGLGLNWMNFHNRQYDPQIGRFLGVDPLAAATGNMSSYAGMNNNPANVVDPLGLMGEMITQDILVENGEAWRLAFNVYKGPSPGREDDIDESTGTGMYAVMLRYAEFMMEVEKQREAGGMTIDQMVDEAKNNPDKTVYFEKGRLVYVSSGIVLEDLEVRDGRADYAGWGKRMDKRFGQSLGWDFGGYGEQGNGGSSAGKIMAGTLLLGATTSELPPVAAAVVVGGTIIAGGAYIYDNWDGIVDGVTTAGESISDAWNWIKGERRQTRKADGTDSPYKKLRPDPNKPGNVLEKNSHTGKTTSKPAPPGFWDWWKTK